MKKSRRLIALIGVTVIGIIGLIWLARSLWQPRTIAEITEASFPGMGMFPGHKVILRPHRSIYIGNAQDRMSGTWKSDDVDYGHCVQAIRQSGFFALGDYYPSSYSDQGIRAISAAYPHGRKTVKEEGNAGPKQIDNIQAQIEKAVSKAHWHKVSNSMDYPPES